MRSQGRRVEQGFFLATVALRALSFLERCGAGQESSSEQAISQIISP